MSSLKHADKKISAVVITGGSSGIGESFIASLIKLEGNPAICNLSRSNPAKKWLDQGVRHISCDLTLGQEIERVVPDIQTFIDEHPGGEVLLINNSGFGGYGEFDSQPLERDLTMIDLNVRACVHLAGRLLPKLIERGGGIINVASTACFQPTPLMATYGATKSFLHSWSLALSDELKGKGVRVLCVCPGPTATNFFRAAGFKESPINVGTTPDAVVEESMKAYFKRKWIVTTGFWNKMGVGISSKLPKVLVTKLSGGTLRKIRQP
ncbi:SDR family NAD(P)-dependent oxidoreductase [Ruficoccus amylovorans]|uniref:SDR family NAD(P)-dependent oxidoreductase n=1 Tax=Ruficoccus amylovorans TaxID=1804625 RepID=A0A842HE68_9BACT|nr:SDR family NAD(P)-dependent oxidoreductase [Ruficoccus amylovorans]MBC2594865.1 SDR family NAD(P)-dependent oxidoreductase [Ruficoccus amylovorans]